MNTAVLAALIEILKDKVQQVITLSFQAVERYNECLQKFSQVTVKSDQHSFEKMLTQLLDRLLDLRIQSKT